MEISQVPLDITQNTFERVQVLQKGTPLGSFKFLKKMEKKFSKILNIAWNPQFLADHQVCHTNLESSDHTLLRGHIEH